MKNNIRKIALGLCLTGALTACDLDVVPPADIAAENFWQTEKDAWYALNTCYSTLDGVDNCVQIMHIATNLGKETSKWYNKTV